MSAPTVAVVMLNAPPVTVLLVKVKAAGKDNVIVDTPVAVISFAVPLMVVIAPIEEALIATLAAAVNCP